MDWFSIAMENSVEIIWIDKNYGEQGSYIPKCSIYPNGAIVLSLKLKEECIEFVALHELGHLVTGGSLVSVHNRIKYLEHCKNEARANRFLIHNIVLDFIEANDYDRTWATAHRLCECLHIGTTYENIKIAQEEIDFAFLESA